MQDFIKVGPTVQNINTNCCEWKNDKEKNKFTTQQTKNVIGKVYGPKCEK